MLGTESKSEAIGPEHGASMAERFGATYKEPPFQERGFFYKSNIHKNTTNAIT
jgi:hypothetical protein